MYGMEIVTVQEACVTPSELLELSGHAAGGSRQIESLDLNLRTTRFLRPLLKPSLPNGRMSIEGHLALFPKVLSRLSIRRFPVMLTLVRPATFASKDTQGVLSSVAFQELTR